MRTPITRSIALASFAALVTLAACEKEQTTPPVDGDAPVADSAGDAPVDPPAEEGGEAPKEGGW
jgi:hypothetical protein